jgi:transcriptional antiterminator NusG
VLAIQSQRWRRIIEKLAELDDVESFYAMRTIWRKQRTGPRKRIERPLIPSYLFVQCDLTSRSARSILSIDGIINFLGIQGVPSPCDDAQLERIRSAQASGNYDETTAAVAEFVLGQTVPISVGPFAQYHGTITSILGDELELDVMLLGRSNTIKVSVDSVRAII